MKLNTLDVVTIKYVLRGPALAVGGTFILSGAALAAASEGLFVFIHRSFKDKDFPCSGAMQGIK
ncbi:hypothetical protein GNY64_003202 [Escherichia coli]|uniref:hypothetical protein n=1 Tax=Escherichia coli TaxID=562 RepID=UPI0010CC2E58|nr:hypothetical protein [Escherichia coli]ECO9803916.1 hypothetical protein [Salmonella enterica]EEC9300350.1 hypothetical protein [Escherichia coli]EEQ5720360.1 hypothetical protein [Escherichia coli]EEQ5730080.1 hypothetical protein [Escherichia coli]EEQ9486885.1 hypothetical protein [Escherichia coli]